jgi:hypothetical protein
MNKSSYNRFAILWAVAVVFQNIATLQIANGIKSSGISLISIADLFSISFAFLLLLRPNSQLLLFLMLICQLLSGFILMPDIANHRLISCIIDLYLLLNFFRKDLNISSLMRTSLGILYFFAAFHKLNSYFLSPETSCANIFLSHIPYFGELALPYYISNALPILTIITEFLLCFFILSSKFLNFGILIGIIFHFTLALDVEKHFFDFSSTMFVMLLFSSKEITTRLSKAEYNRFFRTLSLLILCGGILITICSFGFSYPKIFLTFYLMRPILWWIYASALIYFLINSKIIPIFTKANSIKMDLFTKFIALLCIINGSSIYLGLKNRSAFDMYSNLKITSTTTNHLLVRAPIDLFGWREDPTKIPLVLRKVFGFRPAELDGTCFW